ncbi:MAG TPA: endolytic transglycosylase MltG [Chitinophagaceae bacterium]|nr:endolytic transglycosylase MltG [Chitinophagaceae bacterium]
MKKWIRFIAFALLIIVLFSAWKIFGPSIAQPEGKFFFVKTGSIYSEVTSDLANEKIIKGTSWFKLVAKALKYNVIKPGKYEIKKGMSLFNLVRMLKNGRQTPVDLVIIKFRTKEEFSHRIGKEFETDSTQMMNFLNNRDSLNHYGLDTSTWDYAIIPDTYVYFWNTTPSRIFSKLYSSSQKFWTADRMSKLKEKNLTPLQAYILASIIEEETNFKADKEKIASVYINRINKNMPLQADPTIKFAMRDFGLKRIYEKYLAVPSVFNTYLNKGLPPGPICTPSMETLDAVINAPNTDYIYFVANSDLNGSSVFASEYEEHMKNAKLYQQALNKQDSIRKARQNN